MLKIKNLKVKLDELVLLEDININLNKGELHCIFGPNGAGKSTLFKSLLKDENYNIAGGDILLDGDSLINSSTDEIANKGLMLIMQNPTVIEGVSNIDLLKSSLTVRNIKIDTKEFNNELEDICKKIDLPKSFLYRSVNDGMSGGERKKNELLHMWVLKPKVLLLDEIDSGLDIDALKIVINNIKMYKELYNCSVLLITHNLSILELLRPDYVHILKDKRIIKTGDINLLNDIEKSGFAKFNDINDLEVI